MSDGLVKALAVAGLDTRHGSAGSGIRNDVLPPGARARAEEVDMKSTIERMGPQDRCEEVEEGGDFPEYVVAAKRL